MLIALLAAILFPVFGRARENARRSSCQSNLKQIGLGLLQYTQDYDERTPIHNSDEGSVFNIVYYSMPNTADNWIRGIHPYIKSWQIFRCASTVDYATTNPTHIPLVVNGNNNATYNANGVVMGRSNAVIPNASETILCTEDRIAYGVATLRPYPTAPSNAGQLGAGNYKGWMEASYSSNHFDGGNVLFCDGHVKFRKQSSIAAKEFGLDSTIVGVDNGATAASLF